jgi:chromosome segregation ATPase
MITTEFYILYGILGFVSLLLVTMPVATLRVVKDSAETRGMVLALSQELHRVEQNLSERIDALDRRLNGRMDALESRMDQIEIRMDRIESRMDRLESQMAALRETVFDLGRDVSELKGSVQALHERVDLVMRHRHQVDGEVVLTPEELPAT